MKVKQKSENAGLQLNIQKIKNMASGPITSWQIEGEKVEAVTDFLILGSKIMESQVPFSSICVYMSVPTHPFTLPYTLGTISLFSTSVSQTKTNI